MKITYDPIRLVLEPKILTCVGWVEERNPTFGLRLCWVSQSLNPTYDSKILDRNMKITYDAEVDILRIILSDLSIKDSDEKKPGVILDYDENGNIIGLEILDASKRIDNPRSLKYSISENQ